MQLDNEMHYEQIFYTKHRLQEILYWLLGKTCNIEVTMHQVELAIVTECSFRMEYIQQTAKICSDKQ